MSLDTRGIDPQRLFPQSMEDRLIGWLGRAGGLFLLAGVAVLWACLLSWSVTDPSLTHATATEPRNWLGPLGAILSDLLLQTLGFAAALALLAPVMWSLELLSAERIEHGRGKLGFYPLSVLALAGALSALPVVASWPLHHGYGGVIGDGVLRLVASLFAFVNAQRSGLAAGVLLWIVALALWARSIGFDSEAAVHTVRRALQNYFRDRHVRAVRTTQRVETLYDEHVDTQHPSFEDIDQRIEPEFDHTDGLASGQLLREPLGPHSVVPREYRGSGRDHRHNPSNAAWGEEPAFPFLPGADTARTSHIATDDLSPRETTFDAFTDAESQAIAQRFAPARADRKPSVAPKPNVKSVLNKNSQTAAVASPPTRRRPEPGWQRPSLNLLMRPVPTKPGAEFTQSALRGHARLLEDVLGDFGVKGEVKDIKPGPVVTLYELEPARGTKSSRVIGLADDIARSMSLASVRAAVVSGRNAIGLELPNMRREPVLLREILESEAYKASDATLPLVLGKSIGGEPIVTDLSRMPHLLVAGTTGSGKSVGINAMVLSLLYRHAPEDCRLIMIDPKMLELSVYNGIPHLLTPVVTDPQKAVAALNWAVSEMEERYKRMASLSVRNIDVFNNRIRNAKKRGELLSRTVQTGFDQSGRAVFENQTMDLAPLPHIVIVVDEFADLMIVAGKDVEQAVQRLAQMARAAGIHLIMATQRPSVDIITGTIKANFPTRISFKVTSKIDSRTILNDQGAEQLLGQGDMLFSTGAGQIMRVHGAYVADEEVEAIADALRRQGTPIYVDGILDAPKVSEIASGARETSDDDLYDRAVAIVLRDRKASTSYLQRRLSIGYNRAADLIERMEREGLISAANNVGRRDILVAGSGSADAA
ncbi:MAG: cell division protein FtsK [Hyphomicrobium sp.]|nr:MAG: cell division protein FtsK [Hyphomicrobium sp.]